MDNEKNSMQVEDTPAKKKNLDFVMRILVIVLSVLLVGTVIGWIAVSCSGNDDTTSSESTASAPITEGEETGVYYYAAETEEYLITLNSGNQFTFLVDGANKSGEYALTGEALTFTFNKKEDGQLTATLDGNTLVLAYNNTEMRFLKKVTYTVSFESNGGSAVESVSVVNGKTVVAPANPTRENYIFAGWCTDVACTTALKSTDVITADTTLYARWIAVTPGQSEYVITLDTGDSTTTVTTVGGTIAELETPEKEGYTFAGWWVSETEEADKLSYKYTAGMVFDENTTLYALWVAPTEGGKLEAPIVDVTYNAISWNGVPGAIDYTLVVIGPQGFTNIEDNIGATSKSMDFASYPAGDYVIKVTANASNTANSSDTTVRYYKNKALARVSSFEVLGNTLVFEPVDNAQAYYITVNCGIDEHTHNPFYLGDATYFNFANCAMTADGIEFTVTAVADGYAPSTSITYVVNRTLSDINLYFDEATQTFVWDKVAYATGYVVTVTCGNAAHAHTELNIGNVNTYNLKECAGCENGIVFEVYPVAEGYNSPEAATYTYNKTNLASPGDLRVVDTVLSWSAVEGATSYSIMIGNKVISNVETNSYDLVTAYDWEDGADYEISVKANGETESLWSDSVDMRYYAMSKTLTYKANTISWRPVIGAVKYQVQVNDGPILEIDDGTTEYAVEWTEAGINTVSVRYSDGNVTSGWATVEVYVYQIEFDTRGGASVDPVYRAMGDAIGTLPETTKEGYMLSGWYNTIGGPVNNGAMYNASDRFNANGDIVVYAYWTPKTYKALYELGENGVWKDLAEGAEAPVGYVPFMSTDYTLHVPAAVNTKLVFVGWYTGINGTGTRLTDDTGAAVATWTFSQDMPVYAYFTEVFKFNLLSDNTYSVAKGKNIMLVTSVTIPTTYNNIPVTVVDGYAFDNCYYLRVVNIPDTIKVVETGTAFYGCRRLTDVNVYKAEEGNYEVFYESDGGVLIYNNPTTGQKELALFPVGKGGSYTIPQGVTAIPYKLFSGSKITDVTIPSSVTRIDESAFFNCAQLEKVIFEGSAAGETVLGLQIAEGAFQNCAALTSVSFPARTSYLAVDEETNEMTIFKGCTALRELNMEAGNPRYGSIDGVLTNATKDTLVYCPAGRRGVYTIPASITTVGARAFYNCINLTEIIVHNNVTTIEDYAFYGCENVISVTFKGTAINPLTIGAYAFANNKDMVTVTFAEGSMVESIGDYAFSGCRRLRSVTIPATLATLGEYVFADCLTISSVSFAENGRDLVFGAGTFYNCKSLTAVHLPSTITELPMSLFEGCDNIKGIYVDENNANFCDVDGVVYSKDMTEIYFYSTRLGNFTLPDSVKKINAGVFKNNTNITEFTFSGAIEYIGDSAFEGCLKLQKVTFAEATDATTLYLGNAAFKGCIKLTAFEVPERATELGNELLYNAVSLKELTLHDGITSLGDYVFANTAIKGDVTIPADIVNIGAYAFSKTGITSAHLPESLVTLGIYAFSECSSLNDLVIPEGSLLNAIPEGAFKGTAIESIVITKNVTNIGAQAFDGIKTLSSVVFEEGGTEDLIIGSYDEYGGEEDYDYTGEYVSFAFRDCELIEEIYLPERVTIIGAGTFQNCWSLYYVDIPETSRLTLIGESAFNSSCIESIFIPGTVADRPILGNGAPQTTGIGRSAFAYSSLCEVTFGMDGTEPLTIAMWAFDGTGVTELELPNRIRFDDGEYMYSSLPSSLSSLTMQEGSADYAVVDDILYSADMTRLIFAPRAINHDVVISKETARIEKNAFSSSSKKINVSFEDGGSSELVIMGSAFSRSKIASITFPDRLVNIGASAFDSCTNLASIHISKNVKTIDRYAFNSCSNVTSLTFAEDCALETIGESAFSYCNFTTVEIPAKVLEIANYAFRSSSSSSKNKIKTVTFAEDCQLKQLGNAVFHLSELKEIVLPALVESVGPDAFGQYIEKVTLSEKISDISVMLGTYRNSGNNQYALTSVKEVIVPEGNGYLMNGTKMVGEEEVADTCVVYTKDGSQIVYFAPSADVTNFELLDTVSVIGKNVFKGNTKLKTFEISANVVEVADSAFRDSGLTTLTFETREKPLIIGTSSFRNTSIKSVIIPDSVSEISSYAFYSCDNLTSVEIGVDSILTKLGSRSFGYTAIESFYIPKGVEDLGYGPLAYASDEAGATFTNATKLKTVTIDKNNKNLTAIPYDCFYNTAITSIYIPESVTLIGKYAFENCTKLVDVNNPRTPEEEGYVAGESYIPEGVQTISDYAFYGTKIVTLDVPNTVGTIGNYAFANVKTLQSIKLRDGLETIDNCAFMNCTSLKAIELPNSVSSLGDWTNPNIAPVYQDKIEAEKGQVFYGCTSLESVTLPNKGLEIIKHDMFNGCTSLKEIVIPGNIQTVGNNAFANCTALESVTFQQGVEEIGDYVFDGCSKLVGVELPGSLAEMGVGPFSNCPLFEGVTLSSDNLGFKVEDSVLYNYEQTKLINYPSGRAGTLIIPDSVTEIAPGTFAGSAVEEVVISAGVTVIPDSAFKGCTNLKKVTMHDGITAIADNAFAGCSNLSTILSVEGTETLEQMPSSLRTIGRYAFEYSGITSAYIGSFVTEIEQYAFRGCEDLATLTFQEGGRELLMIGLFAFAESGVTSVTLPHRVRSSAENYKYNNGVAQGAFYNCKDLKTLVVDGEGDATMLPSNLTFGGTNLSYNHNYDSTYYDKDTAAGLKYVSRGVFEGCESLETVHFAAHVADLPYWEFDGDGWYLYFMYVFNSNMFKNCTSLYSVTFEEKDNTQYSFSDSAFEGCTSLTAFTFPKNTYMFGGKMFKNSGLEEIVVPEVLNEWGEESTFEMFSGCTNLRRVTYLPTNSYFSTKMFANCINLEWVNGTETCSVTLPKKSAIYGEVFLNCAKLTGDLVIPTQVTDIRQGAFAGCTGFTSITLHNKLTKLDTNVTETDTIDGVKVPRCTHRVFEGWTAEQTIYTGIQESKKPANWLSTWTKNCEANIVWVE